MEMKRIVKIVNIMNATFVLRSRHLPVRIWESQGPLSLSHGPIRQQTAEAVGRSRLPIPGDSASSRTMLFKFSRMSRRILWAQGSQKNPWLKKKDL